MRISIGNFKNMTQNEVVGNTDKEYIGAWHCNLRKVNSMQSTGAVDAMMKKDVTSIVSAYQKLIVKRGYREFSAGKYQIEIRKSMFDAQPAIVVDVEIE